VVLSAPLNQRQGRPHIPVVGVGTVKRLLLLFLIISTWIALPRTASAWPGFVVFNFQADPLDPLGGTGGGWFATPGSISIRFDMAWNENVSMDFWWEAQHWTGSNSMLSIVELDQFHNIGGWRLDGGLENLGGDIL